MKLTPLLTLTQLLVGSLLAQDTLLLSTGPSGQADGPNSYARISADGYTVVWQTRASNLVPNDTNGADDIVLLDRRTGAFELVSRTPQGGVINATSRQPSISASGRFVAFSTLGSELLPGYGPGVFLYDRQTQALVGASGMTNVGAERPHVSPDGRYVVYIASQAILPEDTNNDDDVYRFDRITGALELVSVDSNGVQSATDCGYATVSSGGRWVAFHTKATGWGAAYGAFAHIWVKDMLTGEVSVASSLPNGTPGNSGSSRAAISADGRRVAFQTVASNLVVIAGAQQIAVKDRLTGAVELVSQNDVGQPANNYNYDPQISPDGRGILFRSAANNLPGGGTNAYFGLWVRDLALQVTRKVSLSSAATGHQSGTDNSWPGGISASGRFVVFTSNAPDLTTDDTNGTGEDTFLRDRFGDALRSYGWREPQTIGCIPHIEGIGTPSASAGSGFSIELQDTRGGQPGFLVYSRAGAAATPLLGSFLYVGSPFVRTQVQVSGGSNQSCNGNFAMDFNAWVASGKDSGLLAGVTVWAQYWSRDTGDPDGAYLSDGLTFVLGQ